MSANGVTLAPVDLCPQCGKPFEKVKNRKYCSPECRQNWNANHHEDRPKRTTAKRPAAAVPCRPEPVSDQTLAAFVLFVRLNPDLSPTSPTIRRAFDAYCALDQ